MNYWTPFFAPSLLSSSSPARTVALSPILLLRSNRFPLFPPKALLLLFRPYFRSCFQCFCELIINIARVQLGHALHRCLVALVEASPPANAISAFLSLPSVYPQASCPNFLLRCSRRCKTPLFGGQKSAFLSLRTGTTLFWLQPDRGKGGGGAKCGTTDADANFVLVLAFIRL